MDKVDECPYCGGTYPHQAPTGCRELPEIAAYKARRGPVQPGTPIAEKYTVVVFDATGRAVLFRQFDAMSPHGALQQMTEQWSIGNKDYGLDTTDMTLAPVALPGSICGQRAWPYTEHNICVRPPNHHGERHRDDKGREFDTDGYPKGGE